MQDFVRKRTCFRLLAALTLCTTSCLPMGLPEHFSSVKFESTHANPRMVLPTALVLVDETRGLGSTANGFDTPTLGHQYLLGIIPFTSVYFEHSEYSFVTEILQDTLHDFGFRVALTTLSQGDSVAAQLRPALIIQPNVQKLRLNAYDLFFLRSLNTDGDVSMSLLFPDKTGELIENARLPLRIDASKYTRLGLAPELSEFARSAIHSSLTRALSAYVSAPKFGRAHLKYLAASDTRIRKNLLILPPRVTLAEDAKFGELLASSYGFATARGFTSNQTSRLIQRGFFKAAVTYGLGVTALSDGELNDFPNLHGASILESSIQIAHDEESDALRLDGLIRLRASRAEQPLVAHSCSSQLPRVRGVDGSWIVTLEEASEKLLTAYLAAPDSPTPTQDSSCHELTNNQ